MSKDLFKQAIAEAKSVREAAIANAKEALEETLTPHLKDMLAAKLQEMDESDIEEEVVDEGLGNDEGYEQNEQEEDELEADVDSEESEEEAEEEAEQIDQVRDPPATRVSLTLTTRGAVWVSPKPSRKVTVIEYSPGNAYSHIKTTLSPMLAKISDS